jgi:hypothetical protein
MPEGYSVNVEKAIGHKSASEIVSPMLNDPSHDLITSI